MNKKHLTALLAALVCLCLLLSACGASSSPAPTAAPGEAPAESAAPAPETEAPAAETAAPVETATPAETGAALDTELPVRVYTLNGTTGFGMAGLMSRSGAGEAALSYSFTVESDASNVAAALVSGECDIAALPTNAAAALYNKTEGGVQVLALNTRGVLYLLSDGTDAVSSFADLAGKTVYVPAQNPSFLFRYLCEANGVNVTIDNSFAQPAELNAAVSAGQVSLAVLPEPMVTVACSQNDKLSVALDLTAEWDKVALPGSLVQGCAVVRRAFAEEHPAELAAFLEEYKASVALLTEDPATAAEAIAANGIFAKAPVAAKAIPNCNVCFVTGMEMQEQLSAFLSILLEAAPQSIGGKLPAEDFYYLGA